MDSDERDYPTYDLANVKACVRARHYRATTAAGEGMLQLDFGLSDICQCYEELATEDFRKSMYAKKPPYAWMDVYRPVYLGVPIYTKFRLDPRGKVHIVSFKEDDNNS